MNVRFDHAGAQALDAALAAAMVAFGTEAADRSQAAAPATLNWEGLHRATFDAAAREVDRLLAEVIDRLALARRAVAAASDWALHEQHRREEVERQRMEDERRRAEEARRIRDAELSGPPTGTTQPPTTTTIAPGRAA